MAEPIQASDVPAVETPTVEPKEVVVEKETIGKALDTQEPKTVPESALLEEKKGRKAAEKALKELKQSIAEGATPKEVSADIDAIAKKHGIDHDFLNELAGVIQQKAEATAEEKFSAKMKPIEARERAEKVEKIFATHYDQAMAEMPEYADLVNRDVIKTLSLDPANADKTFPQLIEETYGRSLRGKRTFETTTPRGGKVNGEVDVARAATDGKYLEEVLSNPDSKKAYNDKLIERVAAHL